jgi:hypothetical protein
MILNSHRFDHAEDMEFEAIMYKEHAEPFFGECAEDYAKMSPEQQQGVIASIINKEYIFELSAKIVQGTKKINILKGHAAANKRARVDDDLK